MGTAGTVGEVTVTPIYWAPTGYSFPTSYQNIINGYISNVAADSGKPTNVFAAGTEYTNGTAHLKYKVNAGTPRSDTAAFPTTQGCTPDPGAVYQDGTGYTACITDAQLQAEIASYLSANSLANDLAHMYLFYLPQGVESCFTTSNGAQGGICSINSSSARTFLGFCGYHSSGPAIYAEMPFSIHSSPTKFTCGADVAGGPGNQSPNANVDADAEISTTSHEMIEAITDPTGTGWYDISGTSGEIGDECNFIYGSGFGGTGGSFYNQTINGAHYFTQQEFSNEDFFTNRANSCIQQEELPIASFSVPTSMALAGSPVSFDGSASSDPDVANGISTYSWNFGDNSSPGTGVSPSHTYATSATYQVTLTVVDISGWQGTVTNSVTVNRGTAPVFTSAPSTTFTVGAAGTFTVTATGNPTPAIAESGSLPSGVTFQDNHNGTATLSGTTAVGGTFPLTLMAANGVTPNGSQKFTLTVNQTTAAPTLTSSNMTTFTVGAAGTFTVTATGSPPPAITVMGNLPDGLTFHDNGNGTATLSGTPTKPGTFTVTFTATNAVTPAATQTFTVKVKPADAGADIAIKEKPGKFVSGRWAYYVLTISNTSSVATTGTITVTDQLPAGLGFRLGFGFGWRCSAKGKNVTCTHDAPLKAHGKSRLILFVRVTAQPRTKLVNTVILSPSDATPADNTATATVTVRRPPREEDDD